MAISERNMKGIGSGLFIIIVLVLASCHKIIELPVTPHIEFRSFAVFDTTDMLGNDCKGGRLKFYFEDGDGDVGINSADIVGLRDSTDLFFACFRKKDGVMKEITDTLDLMKPYNYRIPYMQRTGRNKILKGTIAITFFYTMYSPADSDIIKYRFFIKDRAENVSDTAWTPEIHLSINNVYTK